MMKGLGRVTGVAGLSILALASIAFASNGASQKAAGKSLVVIKQRGNEQQSTDGRFRGRFSLLLNGVIEDSGLTVITPNLGTAKPVDGQPQAPIFGYNNLSSKKGTLNIFFRGVSIVVANIDPTKDPYESEYGTWQIKRGTGIYKGWKGSGRWLNVSTPSGQNFEWDGYALR